MTTVSIREAKNRLTELARLVEKGERIIVTRNGKPVLELGPPTRRGGLNLEAGRDYLLSKGIEPRESWISPDLTIRFLKTFCCSHSPIRPNGSWDEFAS